MGWHRSLYGGGRLPYFPSPPTQCPCAPAGASPAANLPAWSGVVGSAVSRSRGGQCGARTMGAAAVRALGGILVPWRACEGCAGDAAPPVQYYRRPGHLRGQGSTASSWRVAPGWFPGRVPASNRMPMALTPPQCGAEDHEGGRAPSSALASPESRVGRLAGAVTVLSRRRGTRGWPPRSRCRCGSRRVGWRSKSSHEDVGAREPVIVTMQGSEERTLRRAGVTSRAWREGIQKGPSLPQSACQQEP